MLTTHIMGCTTKANGMLRFLRRNCAQMTDMRCRRLLYLALVRSHLSYSRQIWAPQGSTYDLGLFEGIQIQATMFMLQDFDILFRSYQKTVFTISYWLEIKDLLFSFKYVLGLYA